jgi:hypothetical protein
MEYEGSIGLVMRKLKKKKSLIFSFWNLLGARAQIQDFWVFSSSA